MDIFNLRYMKRIRFTLSTLGAWPSYVFDGSPSSKSPLRRYGYTVFLFMMCSVGMVGQIVYLVKSQGVVEFVDLGQTYLTVLLCVVFLQRTMLPLQRSYVVLIEEFALKFHLIHHKHNSDYSAKMYKKIDRICEIATIILHIQTYITSIMFNVAPLYVNYRNGMLSSNRPANGTFEFAVQYYVPVEINGGWYTAICLYNAYATYNLGSMFCCHDLQICVFVFHIWGQMKIFEHNLNYFPRPNAANSKTVPLKYSKEEMNVVVTKLKDIVKQYIMIKEFVAKTSEAYSISLCVYYANNLVSDCILLLECSTKNPDAIVKYGLLTVVMYQQLIQLSVVFELISSKGDSLADAVYGLPWEYMDSGSRRTVLVLLQTVQQSLALKACNMVPVGVQTMLAIVKASFSYFMMLRTFTQL